MAITRRVVLSSALMMTPVAVQAGQKGKHCHKLFGQLEFETLDPDWIRGGEIRFTSGFDPAIIKPLFVPQIVGIPRSTKGAVNTGRILFHADAHAQLSAAFAEIEKQGLLSKMISFGGARYQPRLSKPVDRKGNPFFSKTPSNHSFGTAFDINARDGKHGATAQPFVAIFEANGFLWGGNEFHDPMHFQVDKFRGSRTTPAVPCAPEKPA